VATNTWIAQSQTGRKEHATTVHSATNPDMLEATLQRRIDEQSKRVKNRAVESARQKSMFASKDNYILQGRDAMEPDDEQD
jgi:hypothetical protein